MPFDIHKSKHVVVDIHRKVLVKHKHLLFFEPSLAKSPMNFFFLNLENDARIQLQSKSLQPQTFQKMYKQMTLNNQQG